MLNWSICIGYLLLIINLCLGTYQSISAEVIDRPIALEKLPVDFSIDSLFGAESNPSPLVLELLASPMMQRLKGIDQSGITKYIQNLPAFSRYDHCVGVYMLLKRYERSEVECIAGLLHDASHTVFSHVGDLVFAGGEDKGAYQDKIHAWYLYQQGIDKILVKYGLTIADILPKNPEFIALEQGLPLMCADRIEYNLHTAYLFGLLSKSAMEEILDRLHFDGSVWYFDNAYSARQLADLSLYFTTNLWASFDNLLIYRWTAEALRHALVKNDITSHEMHFSVDSTVLLKLQQTNDAIVHKLLAKCRSINSYAAIVDENDSFDVHLQGKFRGIDPLIKYEGELVLLSEGDAEFNLHWQTVKNKTEQGFYVRFREDQDLNLAPSKLKK